ncbi:YrhA family protein [Hymenobacter terrenus]|uniref:YrhA family protein n=1 Tax=Hymenobacter terrenus TaxID=1629124 RepID=UPI000619AF8A|nr:YrhA family protein [Hymenobacter terrenus]
MPGSKPLLDYLHQIEAIEAQFDDKLQPAASAEDIAQLASNVQEIYHYKLPSTYLHLLAITDGIDFNGYKLYASKTRRIEEYDADMEGFVANGLWEDYEENTDHHLLMFGETRDDLFLFDRRDQQFKVTDKVSGDAYQTFDTFEELAEQLFKNALGIFEDEAEEQA